MRDGRSGPAGGDDRPPVAAPSRTVPPDPSVPSDPAVPPGPSVPSDPAVPPGPSVPSDRAVPPDPTAADPDPWGPVPSGERWRSGRWSLDVRADDLADIRCDDRIVLRGIRAVARDVDWQSARPHDVRLHRDDSSLAIDLDIEDLGLDLRGTVRAEADGDRLVVSFDVAAVSDSSTNRTGLVVLHPPRLAGRPLIVDHTEGGEESMHFPLAISPHQPARDIAALTWSDHGTRFRLDLEGDVFEMEDQRNWSDASYKTYNRSLDEPFPYTLAAGERIRQRVVLTAGARDSSEVDAPAQGSPVLGSPADDRSAISAPAVDPSGPDVLDLIEAGAFPTIAVGAATAPDPGPSGSDPLAVHRHVELELTDPAWPAAHHRALTGIEDLSLLLVTPSPVDETALGEIARVLGDVPLRWAAIVDAASHVSEPDLVAALRSALPADVPVVGGSRSHFTELNREWDRVPRGNLDGLVFATTPLFHTRETEQLVEAVSMQRVIAEDVTARAPGVPVHIGPVTLRPRFNNVATTSRPTPTRTDLCAGYGAHRTGSDDPRQASPELAAWTIASAAALTVPGVASLAFFEEWGPRGLSTADGSALLVRAALEALADLQGGQLLVSGSPDGLLWAIGAQRGHHAEVLVANLSSRTRRVTLRLDGSAADDDRTPSGADRPDGARTMHRTGETVEVGSFRWLPLPLSRR